MVQQPVKESVRIFHIVVIVFITALALQLFKFRQIVHVDHCHRMSESQYFG